MLSILAICLLTFLASGTNSQEGMLYPRLSESREIFDLNGLWNFRADSSPTRNSSFVEKWYTKALSKTGPVIDMPVPSSFNDITQDEHLRLFIGWVWYDKEFYPPSSWSNRRVVLRVESAHYNSIVWVNGVEVMIHEGGHLPFECDVTKQLQYGLLNRVTIAVNNTLLPTTLPPGDLNYDSYLPEPWWQYYQFDFFNYAGIHRSVRLYTTPFTYVSDINITTDISSGTGASQVGQISYSIGVSGSPEAKTTVILKDASNRVVTNKSSAAGVMEISSPRLWWPYTMSSTPGYLYTLEVHVESRKEKDVYRLPIGIRTVKVVNNRFLINGQPFYFHGVNKHEDSNIRGKGLDFPLIIKDFNLLKWLKANSFRTSHYPYAEEIMDLCDRYGIVVIDESPGVGIKKAEYMGPQSLAHHKKVMDELIRRDKNRPSVVMWSVANEPDSSLVEAGPYFKAVFDYTRSLDSSRPVTFVFGNSNTPDLDKVAQYTDVLCLNHYQGWYQTPGNLESIGVYLSLFLTSWNAYYNKSIILSEYGAGAIYGFHTNPPEMYTEDYQVALFKEYHKVLDKLRKEFVIGELVWNFADFMTKQDPKRALGNRKGIFTRERQPKAAAYILKERYESLTEITRS